MENNNLTTIAYRGNVELDLVIGGKRYKIESHNHGTPALKRAFVRFITGQANRTEDLPQYLDLRYLPEGETTWVGCLTTKIPLSSKNWDYDSNPRVDNYVAKFTGNISHDILSKDITDQDTGTYRLFLYSINSELVYTDLAYLDVRAEDLSRISPGTQAIITWSMQLVDVE